MYSIERAKYLPSLAGAEHAMKQGRLLAAHDIAIDAIEIDPECFHIKHIAVLSLARSGFTKRAADLFEELFPDYQDIKTPSILVELKSLKARIEKDWGFKSSGEESRAHFANAAELYEDAFLETNDYYPGVNAASLWLWANNEYKARMISLRCLGNCKFTDDYYGYVSRLELQFIQSKISESDNLIDLALAQNPSIDKRLSTYRQFRKSSEFLPMISGTFERLRPGPVIRFLGQMPWESLDAVFEGKLKQGITNQLVLHRFEKAFGSLAAGADIIIAEEILNHDIPLTVLLPLDTKAFVETSVIPFGDNWLERFEICIEKAAEIKYACETSQPADGIAFRHCSYITMGLAINSAETFMSDAHQLAIWDGQITGKAGGTSEDIQLWNKLGRRQTIISKEGECCDVGLMGTSKVEQKEEQREIKPVLFADFVGFSTLSETQIKTFTQLALGQVADVLDKCGSKVLSANTWGDGIFVIFEDVETAGSAALKISELDWVNEDNDDLAGLEIRIGLHIGPLTKVEDPITKRFTFIGSEISRASRIEPVTPPGSIFVTEAFVAHASTSTKNKLKFEYMGQVELAKSAGTSSIYRLVYKND